MPGAHTSVRADQRGYAMAALLVAMSVMAIVMSTTLPVFQTVAKREREAELVFRGEQYARAIALFQRKYGNSLPPDVDVLIDQRFLRKKYKDPITGGEFQFLGAGSQELAQALSTAPQQALDAARGRGRGGAPTTPPTALRLICNYRAIFACCISSSDPANRFPSACRSSRFCVLF